MNGLIKICGLANAADVEATSSFAPDALGFVFWPKSPRAVRPEQIADWTVDLPTGILKVGVFVDASVEEIRRTADLAGLDIIQVHRGVLPIDLELPIWQVQHLDRLPLVAASTSVAAYLIDSGTVEMPGGSGERVDTGQAAAFVKQSILPVLLAGGLKAGTVGDAIREVRPFGVDVSSGVERAPGRKDMSSVGEFIRNAREAFSTI